MRGTVANAARARRKHPRVVAALLVAAWVATATAVIDVGPDVFRDTRQYLERLEKLGFAGVLLIAVDGEVRLAEGYGLADRERDVPWTPSTVSTIGSITKQFTGAAILRLAQDGRLSVDDRIVNYFAEVPADKSMITLHHLLTHSSGLVDLEGYGDWDPIGREEFVRRSLQQPLAFEPGKGYEYSNAGYSLLGAIIEQVTGRPYERFLRERLLLPNGMYETGYVLPQWGERRMAQGYADGERWGTVLGRPMDEDGPYWVLRANGGIHTTAYDMLRWAQALLDRRVLSPESMQRYWAPHVSEGGDTHYGYGWVVATLPEVRQAARPGLRYVTHNGGNGIHFADMAIVPDAKIVVFLQTNVLASFPAARQLLERIGARIFALAAYPPAPDVVERPADEVSPHAGSYGIDGGGALEVTVEGSSLFIEAAGARAFALLHSTRVPDLERMARLSARLDGIVGAYVDGNFEPLWEAYRRQVTVDYLREGWAERLRPLEQQYGALAGYEVLGTAAAEARDETVVRFRFDRGQFDRTYVWDEGATERLLGMSRRGLNPRLRFVPVDGGGFESWDGGISPSRPLRFETNQNGERQLVLGRGERAVRAVRR